MSPPPCASFSPFVCAQKRLDNDDCAAAGNKEHSSHLRKKENVNKLDEEARLGLLRI